jgi:hypothetical protein
MKASVNIFLDLLLNGLQHFFVAVPDIVHTDASCKINIFLTLNISYDGPFGTFSKDGMDIKRALRYMPIPLRKQ